MCCFNKEQNSNFFELCLSDYTEKVKVSNDQVVVQSERNSYSKNRGGKIAMTIRYLHKENES